MTSPRALRLLDEFTGKGEMFGRVAHGDGAAASVQIDARCSGDLAQDAEHFGHVLRAGAARERKGLLRLQAVLRRFSGVSGAKTSRGIQMAPKGSVCEPRRDMAVRNPHRQRAGARSDSDVRSNSALDPKRSATCS